MHVLSLFDISISFSVSSYSVLLCICLLLLSLSFFPFFPDLCPGILDFMSLLTLLDFSSAFSPAVSFSGPSCPLMVFKIITASGTEEREGGRAGGRESWRKGAGENIKCTFAFNLNIDRLDISVGGHPNPALMEKWPGEVNWETGGQGGREV